ncbi:MAG: ferrochelatase [Gemmatimonas sp.]|nr:ferrochelatase [Gemmatimonas sp.]
MAIPHLLLVNLGTPRLPETEAVREFLLEFLSDEAVVDLPAWFWQPFLKHVVLRRRPARVAELYRSIWTAEGSPLRIETERMVEGVRSLSKGRFTVSSAYRYGEPSLDREMQRLAREGAGRVVAVPLFPQRTDATTGTAIQRAREAAARAGIASRLVNVCIAPNDAGYVEAMTVRCREALAGNDVDHLVVSFHGIPVRYDRREGHQYTDDCAATTQALLKAIRWPAERTTLTYQSKFGFEQWLTPATADVLEDMPRRGVKRVAVITPGFLTEGLETLEEIGIQGRESFVHSGGVHFIRIGAVEAHPAMLRSLAELALRSA